MNTDEISILIEKKASGIITTSEVALLNRMAMNDPALKAEIQLQTDVYKGIEYAAEHELKSLLKDIHKEEFSNDLRQGKIIGLKRIASVAAIFVLGVIAYSNGLLSTLISSNETSLYAANYSPYKASFSSRGSGVEATAKYQAYYDVGNYEKAISIITPFLDNGNPEILLTVGICHMELKNWKQAEFVFEEVIVADNIFYKYHARWYKALTLIQQNEIAAASSELKLITNNKKADHYKDALKLLETIK